MSLKKFDLQKALAGAPCVTRDGHEAKVLFDLDDSECVYPIVVVIRDDNGKWSSEEYTRGGRWDIDSVCDNDLYMAPRKKKFYLAIEKKPLKSSSNAHYATAAYTNKDGFSSGEFEDNKDRWHFIEVEVDDDE